MHKIIVRAFLKVLPRRYFGNVAFKRKRGRVFIVMHGHHIIVCRYNLLRFTF